MSFIGQAMADRTLVDAEARRRAAGELDRTVFVEAGAGSGKTTILVERVVALVASGLPITAIAAITFTERAGAEFAVGRRPIGHRLVQHRHLEFQMLGHVARCR